MSVLINTPKATRFAEGQLTAAVIVIFPDGCRAQEVKQKLVVIAGQARGAFGGRGFVPLLKFANDVRAITTKGI